ncbi:MAG: GNAT family N-acetyltransferase [Gammaproteobacteria bacterium]|jgi:GNAT superfamily N-acetyltransferase|nr:GNAT family N-acetyltransferase [Gammaproteobacteria bacterium]
MNAELKFDGGYRERIGLPGGERVRLRLIQPDDKARLLAGFRQLSAESRASRFLGGKQVLSEAELRHFTEIDQVGHFAIGAVELDARGRECDSVALGRFVRLSGEPRCAEVAIAIADRLQGKGLGLLLLKRLVEAAQERGFERLRFEYPADNIGMHRLIQHAGRIVGRQNRDGVVAVEIELPVGDDVTWRPSIDAFDNMFLLTHGAFQDSLRMQFDWGLGVMNLALDAVCAQTRYWNASPCGWRQAR